MRHYLLLMFCMMTTLCGYSQSAFLLTEDNNYRPSDVVPKMNISLAGIDLACSKLTINTENLVSSRSKFVQTLLDSKDSISDITSIERKKRKYFSLNDDGMYLTGEEDALHKCSFRLRERWLPIHFSANDSIYGLFSGSGIYCKKLHYHKWGEYKTKVMGLDDIVLLTGDTLKNVVRLHTQRKYVCRYLSENSSVIGESVLLSQDSILANLDSASNIIIEEEYRWYVRGFRYPIIEVFMLKKGKGELCKSWAAYCPPEDQEEMSDIANEKERERKIPVPLRGNPQDAYLDYQVIQENDASSLRIKYNLEEPAQLQFILSDTKGIVYKRVCREMEAGGNEDMISYAGLPRGQYVVCIIYKGCEFAEKFTKK